MRVRMAVQTGIVFAACCLYRLAAQTPEPRQQLIAYLDGIAHARLEERKQAVARIQTRAAAEARKNAVRQKILGLIGGLPASRGAGSVKQGGISRPTAICRPITNRRRGAASLRDLRSAQYGRPRGR